MGDLFSNLALGFHVVFQFVPWSPAWLGGGVSIPIPVNILLCLVGALVGTLVGVLPGIGTIATVATQPAKNEPIAAMASAGPARPCFAIWKPSSVVTTELASPGILTRIDVVEPPYCAP